MNSGFDSLLTIVGAFVVLGAVLYGGLLYLGLPFGSLSGQAQRLALIALTGVSVYIGVNG